MITMKLKYKEPINGYVLADSEAVRLTEAHDAKKALYFCEGDGKITLENGVLTVTELQTNS